MKAGKSCVIDMIGMKIDSFLRVEDKEKKRLAEDDDSGDGLSSLIFNRPPMASSDHHHDLDGGEGRTSPSRASNSALVPRLRLGTPCPHSSSRADVASKR